MDLRSDSREFYRLEIATTPAVDAWELSVDGGTTWLAGEVDPDDADITRWLLAGANVAQGTAVAVITASLAPRIRAVDNPEIIIRNAPMIRVP